MKNQHIKVSLLFISILTFNSCLNQQKISDTSIEFQETIAMHDKAAGTKFAIDFIKGENHNNPSFVIWIETLEGELIQTLYVTKSYGTGIFGHADAGDGTWKNKPGESIRPAALPYWSNKRGIINERNNYAPTPKNPVADAYTGATPVSNFLIITGIDKHLSNKFRLLVEVNQPWDWNEYWANNKYPDDLDYKSSCQPSVIYAVTIDPKSEINEYFLNPIGHGHYSGKDGYLYTDLSTLSTALDIFKRIFVKID